MKNIEKYINELSSILKENITIDNIPTYLFGIIKNMNVDELATFLMSEYKDIAPKKLTELQRKELEYMNQRRKKSNLVSNNELWYADTIELVEDYSQFIKGQVYDIARVLENDDNAIVYAEYINFDNRKRNYIELDYKANQNTNIEFKFKISDIRQIFNRNLFGTRDVDYKNRFGFTVTKDGDIYIDIGTKRNTVSYNINDFVGATSTIKLVDKVLTIQINNGDIINLGTMVSTDFTSDLDLVFGALKTGDSITGNVNIDLSYLKVWDTSKSIAIKPIYNDLGKIVLYDEISKQVIEMRGV